MYPRSPPTAGEILEFSQFGKDLFSNVNQLIQPLSQVLHVSGVDPTVFIGGFGILVQIVATHLQKISCMSFSRWTPFRGFACTPSRWKLFSRSF